MRVGVVGVLGRIDFSNAQPRQAAEPAGLRKGRPVLRLERSAVQLNFASDGGEVCVLALEPTWR